MGKSCLERGEENVGGEKEVERLRKYEGGKGEEHVGSMHEYGGMTLMIWGVDR